MITCKVCLVCDVVLIDQTSKWMTAVNVYDSFTPEAYPAKWDRLSFFAILERDLTKDVPAHAFEVVVHVDGQKVCAYPVTINFGENAIYRLGAILNFTGLVLTQPGTIAIELKREHETKCLARYVMPVLPALAAATVRETLQ